MLSGHVNQAVHVNIGLELSQSILWNKYFCRAGSVSEPFVKQTVKLAHEQEPISMW